MSELKKETVANYRRLAQEARHSAFIALTTEIRDEHLRLAATWEKLANEIADSTG